MSEYLALIKDGLHGAIYLGSVDEQQQLDGYLLAASGQSIRGILTAINSGMLSSAL